MKQLLFFALLLVLSLPRLVWATPAPPTTAPSLAGALNADGTLQAGANGSFDARQFRMSTAPDGRPVFRPAGTTGAGDERWTDGFGLPNGTEKAVNAVVRMGTDIYIGGSFNTVGTVPANYVAKWNGSAWSALGTGPATGEGSLVFALAVAPNGKVYATGRFYQADGTSGSYVAEWNGTAWSNLGNGFGYGFYSSNDVYALAVAPNGDVYAGGGFSGNGSVQTSCIARWNGTTWNDVGGGLYAGRNNYAYALAVAANGDVYVGGTFTAAGGVHGVGNVAKWNGTTWSVLGTSTANGVNGQILALAVAGNGDVYVGGTFTQAGGVAANSIAKWNGTSWSSLGAGTANGTDNLVQALALAPNGDVYVGGTFMQAGGAVASRVAKWNGTGWNSLSAGPANGMNNPVKALAIAGNGEVYAGGEFTQAGGAMANRVAKWNGAAWNYCGTGVGNGMSRPVFALAVAGNGDVYAGGTFTQAGGAAANRVARWNGTSWSSLGAGTANGVNGQILALAVAGNGDVYVGGTFTQAGGVAASYVAKWNGTAWSPLGTGTANGTDGTISSLALAPNGDVYVGGDFTQAGGAAANRIARWSGTAWSPLGTGLSRPGFRPGYALALGVAPNGDVYVGSVFPQAGGALANNVAKWNGTVWSNLGTGLLYGGTTFVYALIVVGNGNVYIGGDFAATGDGSKAMVNFAVYDPSAPLLGTKYSAHAAPAAQLFPNPAHGTATLRLPASAPRQPLTLVDALGRTVRRYPAPAAAEAELDLRDLPAGPYVVRCGEFAQRLVVE